MRFSRPFRFTATCRPWPEPLTAFVGYIESYERAPGEDPESEDTSRRREVEALLADIRQADPLPFAHELSEWNELFENLATGVYT